MLRPTTAADVDYVAAHMRQEDIEEVRALSGLSPYEALSIGFVTSKECVTGVGPGGKIIGIAGIVQHQPGFASVWALSTPEVVNAKRLIVTDGRRWVKRMRSKYGQLSNCVSEDNEVHIRLIKYMGFRFKKPFRIPGTATRVIPFRR